METISILGDSMSTFEGMVPDRFAVFYQVELKEKTGVETPADTWWQQVITARKAHLLANSSYSGSMVEGAGFPAVDSDRRIAALAGADGQTPHTIIIFAGINDYGWGGPAAQAAGRSAAMPPAVNTNAIPQQVAGAAPVNAARDFGAAYASVLQRIQKHYPCAEVWCCTLLPGRTEGLTHSNFAYRLRGIHLDEYNYQIRKAAVEQGCHVADIRALGREYLSLEGTHPTKKGMQQLSAMILFAMEHEVELLSCTETEREKLTASESFFDAPKAYQYCQESSCIGCSYATSTGNKWLCTCLKDPS